MSRLAQRFRLEREIGSGGMARVYLGTDEVLDRLVAVKILKPDLADTEVAARFQREGRTAARLSHPNIVQVYDAGEDEFEGYEASYIVMEYVPGGDLKQLIDERGPLPGRDISKLGSRAAAGLAHAHGRGVIHRDIKPHNILLDENEQPKLTDFGIARALDATTSNPTRTGAYLGTALYSSPEQLQGEIVTPKSDIYSLGTTLYQAVTGEPPFTGSPISVANQHVSKPPPSPRHENADVGGELDTLILACLAKDPGERPTAEELSSRLPKLEEATGKTPVYAAPAKQPTRPDSAEEDTRVISDGAPSGAPRRRLGRLGIVAGLLILLAAFALLAAAFIPANFREGGQQGDGPVAQGSKDQKPDGPSGSESGGNGDSDAQAQGSNVEPSPTTASASQTATSTSESASSTAQSTSEAAATSQSTGLTEEAAARTLEEVYTSAAADDYETSYALLTQNFRESTAGSQANWAGTFSTVQDISFVEGPTATVEGNTATVEGTTIARHTDVTERNTGTWRLVNEGGRWKLDDIVSIQTEQV